MPRKKSLLGLRQRKSAPVPTRQLRLFSMDLSPSRSGNSRPGSSRPSRNTERKSRIPIMRTMRHLSLESEERIPSRRSKSAFATPESAFCKGKLVMSTQRRKVYTPSSSMGSIQPWLSTSKKVGKSMKVMNEKYEQAEMVIKIQEFFARQDLSMSIIPSSGLHQRIMTLNLFVSLASHLLSVYYPHHGISMSNYTEKIPKLVKALGYTGNITKSWLRTANNSYSWPYVLKLLSWLVDLAEMKNKILNNMYSNSEDDTDSPVSRKEKFDYFLSTFVFWDQEQFDDIEVATSQLEEKYNVGLCSEEELKALSEEVEQIQQRLQDPQYGEEEARFQQIKAEHDARQEKFVKLSSEVEAQEEILSNSQRELLDLSVQKEQLGKELQDKHKLLQQKQIQVSTQKVSVEEKLLIEEKMRSLQVDIANLEALKSHHMEEICSKDMEISHLLRKVSEEKENFCKKLQDFDDSRVQGLLQNKSIDSREDISQVLNNVASDLKNKLPEMEKQLSGMKSHLEEIKKQSKIVSTELDEESSKVNILHINLEKLEESLKQREAEHMFECQQIENKIKRAKSAAHQHLAEREEVYAKFEAETKKLEELRELRANNARIALETITALYADFEEFRNKTLEEDILKKVLEDFPKELLH